MAEIEFLDEWIPEQMKPGTLFLLENPGTMGEGSNPYWAVLSCPSCGCVGLITRGQFSGLQTVICGGSECSAEFVLEEYGIRHRMPN